MTWLDWVMVAMAIWFVLQGLIKGVVVSLLGAVAVVAGYVISAMAMPVAGLPMAKWIDSLIVSPEFSEEWARTVGFVATYVILYGLFTVLISLLPGAKRPEISGQLLGAGMGLVKALVASMALVGILLASPLAKGISEDLSRSTVAGHVAVLQREGIQTLRRASPFAFPAYGPDEKF
jgi:uncharacterized membrane protein required for colicin V production